MIYKAKNIYTLFIRIITTVQYYYLTFITIALKRSSELAEIKKCVTQLRNFKYNVSTYNDKIYLDKYFSYKYTQYEQDLYNFP